MNKRLIILGVILGLTILLLAAKTVISPTINQPQKTPWKVYQNTKYNFSFSYPANWQMESWDIEDASKLTKVPDGTILYQGRFFNPSMDSTGSPQASSGQADHFEVLVWENKANAAIGQYLTWYRHEDLQLSNLPKKDNAVLAGLPAIQFLQPQTARKKPLRYTFVNYNHKIIELLEEREDIKTIEATGSNQFSHPVFDQILQSWKFGVQ